MRFEGNIGEMSLPVSSGAGDTVSRQTAIVALYESHYERVVRYIAARTGAAAEAEDLASEVFVRALRAAGSFSETGAPLEAWLFKIARNISVDYSRRKSVRPAHVPLEENLPLEDPESPSDELERQDEVRSLGQAMTQLSEAQREVLALRFGSQMTSGQAAAVLGKKPSAVREMQSSAIKKLRDIMREQENR